MELLKLVCGLGLPANARQTYISLTEVKRNLRSEMALERTLVVTKCLTENSRRNGPFGFTTGKRSGPSQWWRPAGGYCWVSCVWSQEAERVQCRCAAHRPLQIHPVTPAHGIMSPVFRVGHHHSSVKASWITPDTHKSVSIVILSPVKLTVRIGCHRHSMENSS